jgi:WD40 repeat protein
MSIRLINSNLLLTGNAEIIAWDLQTMEQAYMLRGHTQFVRYLEPINNGTALLTCADDMRIKLWNLEKRELVKTWEISDRLYAAMQDVNGKKN